MLKQLLLGASASVVVFGSSASAEPHLSYSIDWASEELPAHRGAGHHPSRWDASSPQSSAEPVVSSLNFRGVSSFENGSTFGLRFGVVTDVSGVIYGGGGNAVINFLGGDGFVVGAEFSAPLIDGFSVRSSLDWYDINVDWSNQSGWSSDCVDGSAENAGDRTGLPCGFDFPLMSGDVELLYTVSHGPVELLFGAGARLVVGSSLLWNTTSTNYPAVSNAAPHLSYDPFVSFGGSYQVGSGAVFASANASMRGSRSFTIGYEFNSVPAAGNSGDLGAWNFDVYASSLEAHVERATAWERPEDVADLGYIGLSAETAGISASLSTETAVVTLYGGSVLNADATLARHCGVDQECDGPSLSWRLNDGSGYEFGAEVSVALFDSVTANAELGYQHVTYDDLEKICFKLRRKLRRSRN